MKRREFFNVFMGAVATVAIGLKVAEGVPKVQKIEIQEWTYVAPNGDVSTLQVAFDYGYSIVNPNAIVRISDV